MTEVSDLLTNISEADYFDFDSLLTTEEREVRQRVRKFVLKEVTPIIRV
jgi:hypothetical protein